MWQEARADMENLNEILLSVTKKQSITYDGRSEGVSQKRPKNCVFVSFLEYPNFIRTRRIAGLFKRTLHSTLLTQACNTYA